VDVARVFQPEVHPRFATIEAFVDTVAVGLAVTRVPLAGTDPHGTLSGSAPTGKWLYRVTYYSTTYGITVTNKNFWVAQPCVANRVLAGTHTIDRYYQTSNTITSTANISGSTHIVYDAENITTLNPGFLAPVGSKLEIKTAGCN
jgi:hypothetical protein